MRMLALLMSLLWIGCPAPDTGDSADGMPSTSPPAEPKPDLDVTPAPGEGAPEGAPLPGTVPVAIPSTGEPAADQVAISGTLTYRGSKEGEYRIEFLQVSQGPPTMVHFEVVGGAGDWTVFAPINAGEIRVIAFLDQVGDGASSDDPAAVWPDPVVIGAEAIGGIDLVLSDEPDLGDLTPKDHADAAPDAADGEEGVLTEGARPAGDETPVEGAPAAAPEGELVGQGAP